VVWDLVMTAFSKGRGEKWRLHGSACVCNRSAHIRHQHRRNTIQSQPASKHQDILQLQSSPPTAHPSSETATKNQSPKPHEILSSQDESKQQLDLWHPVQQLQNVVSNPSIGKGLACSSSTSFWKDNWCIGADAALQICGGVRRGEE
jgi:hypothetical protein